MLKSKKTILSLVIILAIIIIGIVTIVTKGFNYSLEYASTTELGIATGIEDIQVSDVKEISDSVLQNEENQVQVIEKNIYITARDITEEQQSEILNKVNEKYSLELSEEDIDANQKVQIDYLDVVYRYISPLAIATIIILLYFAIKYRKQNWLKVIGLTLAVLIIVEALAISVIAIAGIPLSIYTMPVLLGLYILTILVLTYIF